MPFSRAPLRPPRRGRRPASHHPYALPPAWRDQLPPPDAYYLQRLAKLGQPNDQGWASGTCPFHEDRCASLSVKLTDRRGAWRCFAGCGQGDLVTFHMRLTGLAFASAVQDLLKGAR